MSDRRIRVLIAKPGLDGHDQGARGAYPGARRQGQLRGGDVGRAAADLLLYLARGASDNGPVGSHAAHQVDQRLDHRIVHGILEGSGFHRQAVKNGAKYKNRAWPQ